MSDARKPIFIGVAWPYANGGLHLGHVAGSLLPPDIFRRAMRMLGHDVLMVSGSDCHGTPILLKAEAEGRTPAEVVEEFHADHVRALSRLGIGFDLFTRTTTDNHREHVQAMFEAARAQGFIETRTQEAPYDAKAGRFLPDRYVEGTCPYCKTEGARGDQCDHCGKTLDPQELIDPRSKLDPDSPIEFRATEHFFFLLSKLQPELQDYVDANADHWRPNTVNFTRNWLREGLQDRAITRDLTWGVPIPQAAGDYDEKRIYVWFEAVCGYFTAAVEWAKRAAPKGEGWKGILDGAANLATGRPGASAPADAAGWQRWWTDPACKAYYFLGKDNIPFHTIIWPGILSAANHQRKADGEPPLVLPHDVPANEFLNLDGEQFSKSRGISIGVHDVLDRFDADAVRYYLCVNMPEQRDADWRWDDFLAKVNDELVGIIGNLAHRILSFTHKNLGRLPKASDADLDAAIDAAIQACAADMEGHIRAVQLKKGIKRLVEFAVHGNQTMQQAAPWKLIKSEPEKAEAVLGSLMRMVRALAVFMAPYLPVAADRLWAALGEPGSVHDASWSDAAGPLHAGAAMDQPTALFRKLDAKDIPQPDEGEETKPAGKAERTASNPRDDGEGAADGLVAFDDFARLQLRLATVLSVDEHPKADKLLVLRLDVGDLGERQVVAGLKAFYSADELVGQTVAFVANLAPVKLRGIESQGMILAADHDGTVAVLNPHRPLPPGATIR